MNEAVGEKKLRKMEITFTIEVDESALQLSLELVSEWHTLGDIKNLVVHPLKLE